MEETTNLKLPLLVPNQSQKEITHNEALVILDNLVNNGVKDKDLTTPPENPSQNDLYIVGVGAIGEWEGKDNQLAFYDNGWRFCQARQGTKYWVIDENCIYVFNMTSWSKFSGGEGGGSSGSGEGGATSLSQLDDVSLNSISQDDILKFSNGVFTNSKELNNLTGLGINCECDTDNKLAIKSNYVLFDNNGGDSKIKANKSTTTQTVSHLFQDNYSGRAEFGLIGNDDFSLKVSSDGSEWKEAFVVDKTTGNIDFKGEITKNGESIVNYNGNNNLILNDTIVININDSMIEIMNLEQNKKHIFELINIYPMTTNADIYCQLSSNNNYINSYRYSSLYMNVNNGGSYLGNSNINAIPINASATGNYYITNGLSGKIEFYNYQINGNNYINFESATDIGNSNIFSYYGKSSCTLNNSAFDKIKFYLSGSNFKSGIIKHYILN